MNLLMKSGEREIACIAMSLFQKKAEKVKKLTAEIALSTADVDALLSRIGLVVQAVGSSDVHLSYPLRMTLHQGLGMLFEEVVSTQEDEQDLGIDTEGSSAKIAEIRALSARVHEQLSITDVIAERKGEFEEAINRDLPEGTTVTIGLSR